MNLWKNHVLVALVAVIILFAGVSIFKQVTYLPIAEYFPPASTQLAQVSAPTSGLVALHAFGIGGRSFNGTSDYVDMGDSYASFIDGDTKTLAAWVSAGSGSMDARAVAINTTNSRLGLSISAESTWIAEYRRTGDSAAKLNSGSSLSPGTWTHVAVVVNGTTIQIYINGSLAGSASDVELSPAISGSSKNGTIGAWNNNGTRTSFFAGSVNDVRLYNRALDSGEVSTLYAAGQGSQGQVSNPPPPPPADSGSGGVQNPPPASSSGITPTAGNITYYISNSGSDTNPGTQSQPLQTINKCAEVSRAGNTCLILPGRYNEMVETKNAGSSGSLITFKAQGGVIVHQFSIKHPYTRVEGLEITAQGFPLKLDSGFGSAIELTSASHHCEIINNYVHDLFLGISGIKVNGSNHIIKFNRVSRPGLNSMIDLLGSNILVENNTFEDNAGFDVFRLFGTNNTFRRNWVNNIHGNLPPGAPAGNHPDFIQSFGNNGTASHSHLIEQNFISNLESQIGQISPFDADIRDWTFRGNVFYNTKLGFSATLPGMVIENNTTYRVNREGGGFVGFDNNPPRGRDDRGVVRNNVFLALGDGSNNRGGWYDVSSEVISTFYANRNYVAGFASDGYPAKRTDGCLGLDTPYRFCEPESLAIGLNGGNPMLRNETNPLGPDGKPYLIGADPGTVDDDGLRPLASSKLCTNGVGGSYIGAYSCSGSNEGVVLPPVNPPVVPALDTILPTVAITSPATGATVTGTVTVAATASDNVAVLGVQFKLGTNNLGVEDTTSPYSVSWNTSALQPGTYTLTAVARDAAQSKTSTAVTVTIAGPVISSDCSMTNIRCVDDTAGSNQEYTTIQACADAAQVGDTCLVFPGTYREYVQTARGGTSGSPITFKANGAVTVEGFRLRFPYTNIDGFTISKYAVGASPAHLTIEPAASNCRIENNTIKDGVQLLSTYTFNATAKTITSSGGGFLAAGFKPGTKFYIASNVQAPIVNHDLTRTIDSASDAVTDTTIRLVSTDTISSEGPVPALLYATRFGDTTNARPGQGKIGVSGISFVSTSGAGAASNCVIRNNTISNLGGSVLSLQGSGHLFERNIIERTNGWGIIRIIGSNNTLQYNHIKNSPRYPGLKPPLQTGDEEKVDQSTGEYWDFVDNLLESYGSINTPTRNNKFEYNFVENIDNEIFRFNVETPGISGTYQPADGFIIKNNVFYGIEKGGAIHKPGTIFINNTFYKAAHRASGHVFAVSNNQNGSADGSIIKNNVFVENGDGTRDNGWYSLNPATGYAPTVMGETPDYNFVAGSAAAGFPARANFSEPHTVSNKLNGGNPKFQNINNPVGPDGRAFTSDDGLIPLAGSALCTGGQNGTYVGAYPCEGVVPTQPQENDTTPPTISITTPAAGATVSGLVNLVASASDDKGVVGVQFKVDGVNLGSELTTAPYSGTWNTQGVSSGNHILTAVARDAAGNSKTSGPVIVTVSSIKVNRAPVSFAGNDQIITLPATLTLQGSGLDLDQDTLTYSWSKVSGPVATFSANTANTTVTFSGEGTYVLRLTVSDGVLTGSDTVTITVHAPVDPTKDTDGDGIYDGTDKCPLTPVALKSRVNSLGCPLPKMDSFTKKTDLSNVDLRSVQYLELSNSDGKIVFSTPLVLIRGSATESLDIDSHLTISNRTVYLRSANLSELNKPATITLYRISYKNPRITKDSVPCSQCSILSYAGGNIVFTVPSFSMYTVEETPEDARNEKGQFTPTVPQLPPAPVTPPPSQPSFLQRFIPSFLSPNRQSTSPSTVTQPPKATGPFVPLSDVSPEDGSTRSSDQSITETVYVVIKYIYERILNGWERLWGN